MARHPLAAAAAVNDAKAIKDLLRTGAAIDAIVDEEGNTALHIAARRGCTDAVVALLRAGASSRVANKAGRYAPTLCPTEDQLADFIAMEAARATIADMPRDTGEGYFKYVAALNFIDGAKIPQCPAVPPEGCLRAYQRMGMVAQLAARLCHIRCVIEEQWHDASALADAGQSLCVTAPFLFAMANHASYGGVVDATSRPVAAAREFLAHPGTLEAIAALACMPGDVHAAMHAGGPRLMIGCMHARTVLLVVGETLSNWQLDAPAGQEARLAEESRRGFARLLKGQLACMEGVLLLKPAGGTDQVVGLWPLAASMCWSEEGAAARKLLLHIPKLKQALELSLQNLLAAGGAKCASKDQAEALEELNGLVQFLREGVGSASAADPEDLAAVQQLLCRSTVDSCLACVDQLFARCKELQAFLEQADDDEQPKQQDAGPAAPRKAGSSKKRANKAAKKSTKATSKQREAEREAAADRLAWCGEAAFSLACALMDCARLCPALHLGLVQGGRVLGYIEAFKGFLHAHAAGWMRFLAAAVSPEPPRGTAVGRQLWQEGATSLAAELCERSKGTRLSSLASLPLQTRTSLECQQAALLMATALTRNVSECCICWLPSLVKVALAGCDCTRGAPQHVRWEDTLSAALEFGILSVATHPSQLSLPPDMSPLGVLYSLITCQGKYLSSSPAHSLRPATVVASLRLLTTSLQQLPSTAKVAIDQGTMTSIFAILANTTHTPPPVANAACQALLYLGERPDCSGALAGAFSGMLAWQVFQRLLLICGRRRPQPKDAAPSGAEVAVPSTGASPPSECQGASASSAASENVAAVLAVRVLTRLLALGIGFELLRRAEVELLVGARWLVQEYGWVQLRAGTTCTLGQAYKMLLEYVSPSAKGARLGEGLERHLGALRHVLLQQQDQEEQQKQRKEQQQQQQQRQQQQQQQQEGGARSDREHVAGSARAEEGCLGGYGEAAQERPGQSVQVYEGGNEQAGGVVGDAGEVEGRAGAGKGGVRGAAALAVSGSSSGNHAADVAQQTTGASAVDLAGGSTGAGPGGVAGVRAAAGAADIGEASPAAGTANEAAGRQAAMGVVGGTGRQGAVRSPGVAAGKGVPDRRAAAAAGAAGGVVEQAVAGPAGGGGNGGVQEVVAGKPAGDAAAGLTEPEEPEGAAGKSMGAALATSQGAVQGTEPPSLDADMAPEALERLALSKMLDVVASQQPGSGRQGINSIAVMSVLVAVGGVLDAGVLQPGGKLGCVLGHGAFWGAVGGISRAADAAVGGGYDGLTVLLGKGLITKRQRLLEQYPSGGLQAAECAGLSREAGRAEGAMPNGGHLAVPPAPLAAASGDAAAGLISSCGNEQSASGKHGSIGIWPNAAVAQEVGGAAVGMAEHTERDSCRVAISSSQPDAARRSAVEGAQQQVCKLCGVQGTPEAHLLKCSRCRVERYCSTDCQRRDWARHRTECISVGEVKKVNKQKGRMH